MREGCGYDRKDKFRVSMLMWPKVKTLPWR